MFSPARCFLPIMFVLIWCACGGDDSNDSSNESGSEGNADSQTGSGAESVGSNDPTSSANPECGNGITEPANKEECDDSNADDTDGCTSLCEYSCHSDSECQENECNGFDSVCDQETHSCTPGSGAKADGESCGTNGSCRSGACVEHACNNGYEEPGEDCDDGDEDDYNGCTTECKFTCVSDDDSYPTCENSCDSTAYCDDTTHSCIAGDPMPDDTICDEGDGYCSNGRCILSKCGDGVVQPNEECDPGNPNPEFGSPSSGSDSECQPNCTIGICGNGELEGREQCDDGNTDKMDGCDPKCRVELITSPASFAVTSEKAPDFCVYEGNAFGEFIEKAIDSMIEASQSEDVQQTMEDVEEQIPEEDVEAAQEEQEPLVPLFHLLDIDDPTMKTADTLINFGVGFAQPVSDAVGPDGLDYSETEDRLDFPILLYPEFYDEDLDPIAGGEAELRIEGDKPVLYSQRPFSMGMKQGEADMGDDMQAMANIALLFGMNLEQMMKEISNMEFVIDNIMVSMEIDPERSKISPPPETAFEVPESAGHYDPAFMEEIMEGMEGMMNNEDGSTTEVMENPFDPSNEKMPTGILCGTLDSKMFDSIGVPYFYIPILNISLATLCPDQASQITSCRGDMSTAEGECSSILDLLQIGCTGGGMFNLEPLGPPDVDNDGDGTNESYSLVFRMAVQRLKMAGFTEDEPMFIPIPQESQESQE